jgi:hypothetical protein
MSELKDRIPELTVDAGNPRARYPSECLLVVSETQCLTASDCEQCWPNLKQNPLAFGRFGPFKVKRPAEDAVDSTEPLTDGLAPCEMPAPNSAAQAPRRYRPVLAGDEGFFKVEAIEKSDSRSAIDKKRLNRHSSLSQSVI